MPPEIIWSIISSALVAGIVSTSITIFYDRWKANKEVKLDLARRLIGFRSAPANEEFLRALNEIPIIFNNHREVMDAWLVFSRKTVKNDVHGANELLTLLKRILRAVNIHIDKLNDDDILTFITTSNPKLK